jgi:DNA-binding response OmpR family regulator
MRTATIMLVGKDPVIQKRLRALCDENGYTLVNSENDDKAMDLMKDRPVDLVIIASTVSSYSLEEWHLASRLRRLRHRIPIIALTDQSMPGDTLRAYSCGIDELLTSGIDFNSFHLYLESHLKNTGKASYGRQTAPPGFASEKRIPY